MRQARGGVSRAGGRGGGQGGGCDGRGDEAPSCAVSPQGGRRDGRTVQSHADPALDLFGPQLSVLLLLLDESGCVKFNTMKLKHCAAVQELSKT